MTSSELVRHVEEGGVIKYVGSRGLPSIVREVDKSNIANAYAASTILAFPHDWAIVKPKKKITYLCFEVSNADSVVLEWYKSEHGMCRMPLDRKLKRVRREEFDRGTEVDCD